jgi:hypothetical protein
MLISTGGIGSADEELAFFPQNGAAVPINRAGIARSARPLHPSARLIPGHSARTDERTSAL